MTLPAVKVEIAFDSGYTTPAASRTWTDVTEWWEAAEGYAITRGRPDELSQVSPSTLSLTFDNTDGRFTPGRSASPYYPNVKVGRPIRVTVTPDGGAASVRFVGYVDEWPVEWDGTDAYAKVAVTATSRTARLGQSAALRSLIVEEFALDNPVAHYPLAEGDGARSAADCSGNARPLRVGGVGAPVIFGEATGPGTDGASAATFQGGQWMYVDLPDPLVDTLEMFINTTAVNQAIAELSNVVAAHRLTVSATGRLTVTTGLVSATGTTNIADGTTHHILVTDDAFTTRIYIDGVQEATIAAGIGGDVLHLGRCVFNADGFVVPPPFTGTLSHVAAYVGPVSAARVAAHAAAGSSGFAGETPGARLARYAGYTSLPASETSFATGTAPIAHTDPTGQGVVELMQAVADADGGWLFDARDGTLVYQSRDVRYQAGIALTLMADAQQLGSDFAPKLDRSALVNDVTVSNPAGTLSVRARDAASEGTYGLYSESLTLMTDSETELSAAAWWRVSTRAEPTPRVSTLSVSLLDLGEDDQDAALALDLSSRVAVSGLPSQAPAASGDYFVEGYTETLTDVSHTLTLNVADTSLWIATWVLDSATRSKLDTTTTLAY